MNKVIVAISLLFLVNCGSIYFVPHEETTNSTTEVAEHREDSKPKYRARFECKDCNMSMTGSLLFSNHFIHKVWDKTPFFAAIYWGG